MMDTRASSVLILGATSDMARALARQCVAAGRPVILAARDPAALADDAADLRVRANVPVTVIAFEAEAIDTHGAFVDALPDLPALAVCLVGSLGDQGTAQRDPRAAARIFRTNLEGPASILGELANRMEARGWGTLVGVSSVAGERGRASNYLYGSAKAGFTAFLSGLRHRLARRGVHVVTVKPGFVRTRMTAGMALPAALTAEPADVARAILAAEAKQQNVVYVYRVWFVIMTIIRCLPEAIFKKTNL